MEDLENEDLYIVLLSNKLVEKGNSLYTNISNQLYDALKPEKNVW